jgi:hypothetical protein
LNIKERQPLKKTMVETIFNKTTWFQGESLRVNLGDSKVGLISLPGSNHIYGRWRNNKNKKIK